MLTPPPGVRLHNRGFIALPLWGYILAGMGVALLLASGATYIQTKRLNASEARYSAFVAKVDAAGKEQERRTKETIDRDRKSKERADAENKRLRAANSALSDSLRNTRSSVSILPAPAGGSSRPDLACYERGYLERVLSEFVEGAAKLVAEGDADRTDLNTAKSWAQGR